MPKAAQASGLREGQALCIHPTSINCSLRSSQLKHAYLVFLEKVKTSRVFIRDCSVVSPLTVLLFGGALTVMHEEAAILVDGWLRIPAPAQTAVLVKQMRAAVDGLLQHKVHSPGSDWTDAQRAVVDTLVKLLEDAERQA